MAMQKIIGLEEIKENKGNVIWRAAAAEFSGNLLLNLFACGSIVWAPQADEVRFSLAFGLTIYLIVQTLGHVSGGHFNPAVSAGMLVTGNIGIIKFFIYLIAQCLGAIAGTALLIVLSPEGYKGNYGNTQLAPEMSYLTGLIIEFFLGFILIFTVFGFCDPDRPETNPTGSMSVGFAVGVGHLGFINATGASMNPARSLGTALIAKQWDWHTIYWAGPIAGGIVAALLYRWIFAQKDLGYETVPTDERKQTA